MLLFHRSFLISLSLLNWILRLSILERLFKNRDKDLEGMSGQMEIIFKGCEKKINKLVKEGIFEVMAQVTLAFIF